MGVSLQQSTKVAAYVLKQRLLRRERYPLVLMLEPLLRCNLACGGCGECSDGQCEDNRGAQHGWRVGYTMTVYNSGGHAARARDPAGQL